MITVEHLSHRYPGTQTKAVDDVTFSIEKGEIFGFLGPSGAGKSTTQAIITGLLPLQEGQVTVEGVPISQLGRGFNNRLGISFELPYIYQKLTGYENLHYYAGLFDVPTEDPLKLLRMVGLEDAAHQRAGKYSRGMKQRLNFARSLVNRPEILFLDEPTAGLDPGTAGTIKDIIRQQAQRGATIFLTTHNMFTADALCDRVAFINEGCLVAMDSPRNLKLKFGQKSVQVEYGEDSQFQRASFSLENTAEKTAFLNLIHNNTIQTMHTQEATLEEIFLQLTGRRLS
jgi:fluoroquinolone transport system ATP-binding protein